MAKGTVKRKPTPSTLRKKRAQQRIRKQAKHKLAQRRPNWRAAIAKTYMSTTGNKTHTTQEQRRRGKRARGDADDNKNDDDVAGLSDGDDNNEVAADEDDGAEVQSDVDEEKQTRLNERDPLDTQLFLKNLPLDTSEDELMAFFASRFAPVRRVLLVRNRSTGTLSGSGFVHCGTAGLATQIYGAAQQNARDVAAGVRADVQQQTAGMSRHQAKRLMHKLRGNTTVARDPFLTMRETQFTVHRVLTRSDAHDVVAAAQKATTAKAKPSTKIAADEPRNLYLLQEGLVLPDTAAARGLHPRYLQMISDDYERRKAQLLDSNYFVSKTRLSVRNLPRTMTENDLRRLFARPIRAFLAAHPEHTERDKWGKYGPIRQVKVLRDAAGVSRGYGFIECINHPIALHALRMLNNNPTLFGDQRRLMVSFAIENVNAVQKLQRMKALKRQKRAATTPSSKTVSTTTSTSTTMSTASAHKAKAVVRRPGRTRGAPTRGKNKNNSSNSSN